MRKAAVTLVAGVCAALFGAANDAGACGMGFDPHWSRELAIASRGDPQPAIEQAEHLVAMGRFGEAAALVKERLPYPALADREGGPLVDRALQLLAQIQLRTPVPGDVSEDELAARAQRIDWAVGVLTMLAEDDANPAVLSDLGEGLAQQPDQQDVARYILEKLAERDLLATPEAYAALGRLRALAGDEAGVAAAFARCQLMTGYAAACARQAPNQV